MEKEKKELLMQQIEKLNEVILALEENFNVEESHGWIGSFHTPIEPSVWLHPLVESVQ